MEEERVDEIVAIEGLVVELDTEGEMTDVTVVEPLNIPTIFIIEVSTMLSKAAKLLMKLVVELALLQNWLMSIAKWVVNWIESVS